jgi:hypothetical protein
MADDREEKSAAGGIVIGVAGAAVAVFIIDYFMSDPGESWFDKMIGKGKEGPPVTPGPEEAHAPEIHRGPAPPAPYPLPSRGIGQVARRPPAERAPAPWGAAPQRGAPQRGAPGGVAPSLAASPDLVREVQSRLNSLDLFSFRTWLTSRGLPSIPQSVQIPLAVDGTFGRNTQEVLRAFQGGYSLPATGMIDQATLATLRSITSRAGPVTYTRAPSPAEIAHRTGQAAAVTQAAQAATQVASQAAVPAGGGGADWHLEASSLPPAALDVIDHAIASETDVRKLRALSNLLRQASFPQAAAAVAAKMGGAPASAQRSGGVKTGYGELYNFGHAWLPPGLVDRPETFLDFRDSPFEDPYLMGWW